MQHSGLHIRVATQADVADVARAMKEFWPEEPPEEMDRLAEARISQEAPAPLFVCADAAGRFAGFLFIDIRRHAEGCWGRDIPFIEGWWVEPSHRRRGVGRALMQQAEAWARQNGYREIGSDTLLSNHESRAAHAALGYRELPAIVPFLKSIGIRA